MGARGLFWAFSAYCAAGALAICLVPERDALQSPRIEPPAASQSARLSVPFMANSGRHPPEVLYTAGTFAGPVSVTADGDLVYALRGATGHRAARTLVRERLVEPGSARVAPTRSSATRVADFRGADPARWRTGVPAWSSVLVAVAHGVEVEVRATGTNVEKVFRVAPRADASAIRVDVQGVDSLRVLPTGELEASTAAGPLRFTAPYAYQETGSGRRAIPAAYEVDGTAYGFRVEDRDPSLPLVIDPLLASTYLGRGSDDDARDLDVHWATGHVYVAGSTMSPDFPADAGAWGMEYRGGDGDAFVAVLTPDMTTLVVFAYLGGTGTDGANGVAISTRGVFVVGTTTSTDFPTTPGVYGPSFRGGASDGFAAHLSFDLQTLVACTYHGGNGADALRDVAGAAGFQFIGETDSTDLWFPERAMQKEIAGGTDLLFASVREDLLSVSFQSLLGGSGDETASRMRDGEGEVIATGRTTSDDFPTTPGAYRTARQGDQDAFVLRIWEDYHALLASTYLGGDASSGEFETGAGIDWHGIDGICVAGTTNAHDFPTTEGAWDRTWTGDDGFVAVLDLGLTTLRASTYLGGSGDDAATSVVSDGTSLYVAGTTSSADFPAVTSSIDTTYNGRGDAFVARLTGDLTALTGSAFLGSAWPDEARALKLHGGTLFVTGNTQGWDFPTTPGAFDDQFDTSGPQPDAFVTALTLEAGAGTDAFVLPRKVNVRREVVAERSRLAANGTLDTGSGAAGFAFPATLTVGAAEFDFPALPVRRGRAYVYDGDDATLRVVPSKTGSSRAAFRMKAKGAAASTIDPDAPLAIRFRSGPVDGRGEVLLTAGRYKLGKVRGALLAPAVFPYGCAAKLESGATDTLSLQLGLASGGVTPAEAPDFTLWLGPSFAQTVPAAAFQRKGDRYVFRSAPVPLAKGAHPPPVGSRPGLFTSVTLDYARERIVVAGNALELGAYVQGSQPVRIAVKLGDAPEQAVTVRMVCKAVRLRY